MSVINIENYRERNAFPTLGSNALRPISIPEEICLSTEGYIAPRAGARAIGIQSRGLERVDEELAKFERTGEFTEDTARASYNAFVRLAIVRGNGNVVNVSGAIRLPEGVSPHFLLEDIGQKTLGVEARVARYGRMSLMSADLDEVKVEELFSRMTTATAQMHSDSFSDKEARVLNNLQNKRREELVAQAELVNGVLEGRIDPNIAAISDESNGKEHFLWTGKREDGKIKGINPDGEWQDQSELSRFAPDLVTKGLLAHELDLLLSAEEGKVRVIFIGDNEAYVKRCCVSASNDQQRKVWTSEELEKQLNENKLNRGESSDILFSGSDDVLSYSASSGAGGRVESDNCSTCGKDKYEEDGCKCSAAKS